ncbi:MAG TPA: hypothetical protein PLZ15_07590 [Melioribacteraceae bacterium]|nr:hypothetical protein [Melioribacteraceae bacterium]
MKKNICFLFFSFSLLLNGQSEIKNFGISFSGYVKSDFIYDTRQTVSLREGHFFLYPQIENLDINGKDINAKSSFNILSIQTRLNGLITGPDAFGAKTSGQIEAEFFGTVEGDINGFRLRHAFVKFDWDKTSLLIGQTWHPMFVAEMFPGVVSFNTGSPFQPFSRNPQIRFTYSVENLKFILAALSQRDFQSNGPNGFSSSYLRNSVIPNLHAQVQYSIKSNLFGAGIDYKRITPRLSTTKNVATDNSISSLSAIGYMKLSIAPVILKTEVVYGNNLADHLMLGGYAIKSINAITGEEEYTPASVFSFWGEISTGKEIEFALFGGYSKYLGAEDNIVGSFFGRGNNIDNLLRISPRIQLNSGKARLAAELEYTSAGYGTPDNLNKGKVENVKSVSNLRLLFAVFYFF